MDKSINDCLNTVNQSVEAKKNNKKKKRQCHTKNRRSVQTNT